MTAIWWIRRDLRLHDSPALARAAQHGDVVPVFVIDPALLESRYHRGASRRKAFLFAGLRALDLSLRARGSRLVVRRGSPAHVLPRVAREADAEIVAAAEDFSPYSRRRDEAVGRRLPLLLTGGVAVRPPGQVLTNDGRPFQVFGPYSRAWLRAAPQRSEVLEPPARLGAVPAHVEGEPVPHPLAPDGFPAGEAEASRRFHAFATGEGAPIDSYAEQRDRLDLAATSVLSPYLRFGMLSPRLAAVSAAERLVASQTDQARHGVETWLNELIWRDFYISILGHFPGVLNKEHAPHLRNLRWRNEPGEIAAWKQGRTGYPVVDAAMRHLVATGWLHNRARMIVASFLVKHLLVDWRIGEAFFMEQLVDGDPAANNGGWQWTAGVGASAAPYFRVLNPVIQGKRFDPHGDFITRWVPELADLPLEYRHEPWRMPRAVQPGANGRTGPDYPAPIVDLAAGKARALEAFGRAKNAEPDAGG